MITTADLKAQTRRELADLARNYGVPGWHGLKKDELIEEIKKVQRRLRRKAATAKSRPRSAKLRKVVQASAKVNRRRSAAKLRNRSRQVSRRKLASIEARDSSPARAPAAKLAEWPGAASQRPMPKLPEPKVSAKTARIRAQIRKRRETMLRNKDLSTGTLVGGAAVNVVPIEPRPNEPHQDRVILVGSRFLLVASELGNHAGQC